MSNAKPTPNPSQIRSSDITPPPELVQQWYDEAKLDPCGPTNWVATRAAQWGVDQELEACCEWLRDNGYWRGAEDLHAARRPKPPSLAEQALEAQKRLWDGKSTHDDWHVIRRALECLKELEEQQ